MQGAPSCTVNLVEGLQIAAELERLPRLPLNTAGWRFPDEGSAVLVLPQGELLLRYRPPDPSLGLLEKAGGGPPRTPFQQLLSARARGPLQNVQQLKLDRVVFFDFGGESGFVAVPPTRLVFELTGRNANLILLDAEGRIIGADRFIGPEVNRYRQVRPGLVYTPPPPYEKLDPFNLSAADLRPLLGQPLARALVAHVDGIGPRLAREAARRAGLDPHKRLEDAYLQPLAAAIAELAADPRSSEAAPAGWREEAAASLRKPLLAALEHRRKALQRRLQDFERARADAARAAEWRHLGDLILAYAHQLEPGAPEVTLPDWEGGARRVQLDPRLDAATNARRYYQKARRATRRAERADRQEPRLRRELAELEERLARVAAADLAELRRLHKQLAKEERAAVGLRLKSPGGFDVWVGRNGKENDLLTRAAHSGDVWLHAQGVPGSHVILRTMGKAAPLEDLLYAARLAAYHSKARGEKNVPVDYTLKKHVWRPRKAAPGQALYTRAKTLFVDATRPEE